ncbi:hypothetical protein V8G54_025382 [Vigna mungo]|uniref:Uncharacterized protein n=1 Tax=Vigna mungo TaxID=3915 RepID=A0AAQ3RNA3_VIGMU
MLADDSCLFGSMPKYPANATVLIFFPFPGGCILLQMAPTEMVGSTDRTDTTRCSPTRRKRQGESFSTKEPTSPKVSCIGQVQDKKKRKARKQKKAQTQKDSTKTVDYVGELKKIVLWIRKGSDEGQKHNALEEKIVEASSLNTMKKFVSGRGSLYDFDVTIAKR